MQSFVGTVTACMPSKLAWRCGGCEGALVSDVGVQRSGSEDRANTGYVFG